MPAGKKARLSRESDPLSDCQVLCYEDCQGGGTLDAVYLIGQKATYRVSPKRDLVDHSTYLMVDGDTAAQQYRNVVEKGMTLGML